MLHLKKNISRRLLTFLTPYRRRFAAAMLCMVAYGATDGVVPLLIRRVLDDIFGNRDRYMLYALPAVIVFFALFRGVFGFLQHYLTASVGLSVVADMRNAIGAHLLKLSPSFFEKHTTGSLISRVTNDTLLVRYALTDAVATLIRDSIRMVALLCVAIYLDKVLAAIALIGIPACLWPVVVFGKKVKRLSRKGQDQFGGLTGILQENIVGHKVVQSFSNEDFEMRRFEGENVTLTKTLLKTEKYSALSGPTNELAASLAMCAVIIYGANSVMNGIRTQGDFIAFITAMFLLYEPWKKLGRVNGIFQTGAGAAERIFEVLDAQSDVLEKPEAKELDARGAPIEYRNVHFRYGKENGHDGDAPQEDRSWALEDISLRIDSGRTLALVGMSGGGKSTLVNLLPRFYDPQLGSVTIGGTDIRDASLSSLRRSIATVSQHTFLFNDTVYSNILYGRLDAGEEEVQAAAKAANAHDFIMRLPEGYGTVIGEQGLRLSGGERARIAIARALLKNAPILVLDEATASLDSESEALVQSAIDRLMEHRTVLVIAHRLATVRRAHRIAVIVQGRLVEYGAHEELLAKGGEYAKLHAIQFRDGSEEVAAEGVL